MRRVNVAVIGVGVVGVEILKILRQRDFPVRELRVFARSAREIEVDNVKYKVQAVADEDFDGIDIALFAGTEGEKGAAVLYADKFIKRGAVVIDNGNDFRLKTDVPLVVPEVNKNAISKHKGLVANPNCTTIQAVVALGGIYKYFGLEKIILTSFQATSGAGRKAAVSLWEETKELVEQNRGVEFEALDKKIRSRPQEFSHQIAFNVIPQIGAFIDEGYTSEEGKVVRESHKIFGDNKIRISATCVRVPVFISHSEAIYFTPRRNATLPELHRILAATEGVNFMRNGLSLPLMGEGTDEVFVARLRRDPFAKNSFWLWCVADNLRKGAALNAVQIAECLL